jgi:glutamine amidotransferase
VENCSNAIATTDYIEIYSSAVHKNNFYAVQFHPEKSGEAGQKILENFINGK